MDVLYHCYISRESLSDIFGGLSLVCPTLSTMYQLCTPTITMITQSFYLFSIHHAALFEALSTVSNALFELTRQNLNPTHCRVLATGDALFK